MENKIFSLSIYKEEYNANQLNYIKENFLVIEESGSRLIISASMKNIDKIMSAVFANDERFKQIFPLYQTAEDRVEEINERLNELVEGIEITILQAAKLGCNRHNSEIYKLFANFYLDKLMPLKNRKLKHYQPI